MISPLIKPLVFVLGTLPAALGGEPSPLWTAYQAAPDTHPNLPNVSYAGYRNGEAPLPNPAANVLNVKSAPFRAHGDGITDDTAAIRQAIGAAGEKGGVVYFPDGEYVVSGVLFVHQSHTILRGQSREGVRLRFTKPLATAYGLNHQPGDPPGQERSRWSWSGGLIWFTPPSKNTYRENTEPVLKFNDSWIVGPELATLLPAKRGDRAVTMGGVGVGAGGLTAGQFVCIRQTNPPDFSLMKHLCGDGPWAEGYLWTQANSAGMRPGNPPQIDWVVEVQAVAGTTLTLKQPLRWDLRAAWSPRVMALGETIRESGIENMTVVLARDYQWNAKAHHNKEPGWNGPWFDCAVNCFLRGVTVVNADSAFLASACKNVTFSDFKSAFSAPELRAHHHGTTCSRYSQDVLFEKFVIESEPWHGISCEQYSMGIVWSRGTMAYGTFDTHRNVPSESLRTQITINNTGFAGGTGGPRMGARFANWNVTVTNGRSYLIGEAQEMPKGVLAGVTGCKMASAVHSAYGDAECIIPSSGITGAPVFPSNLYEAQLALRLGKARAPLEKPLAQP